jgi:glycosyltransferase involved in cell wall biosynthesis
VRIALVGPYPADSARVRGGVEAAFTSLLSGLAALDGTEPYVVTFVPGLDRPTRDVVGGVSIVRLPGTNRLGNLTLHIRERRELAAALEEIRPDVVHAQDALRYGYVCLKAERGVPVVVSVHGIVHEERKYLTTLHARVEIGLAGVALERYCVRHARFLLAPTRYAEDYFGSQIRGRLWDIGNPVPESFFSVRRDPEPGRILQAGALIPRKRLLDLVEALPHVLGEVPEAHVRVTGGQPDPAYADLVRRRVRRLGIGDRVDVLGPVTFDELLEEYRRASLLVLPSGEETSPMAIGEAMAAGLPVVATRVGGVHYLVEEDVTGHLVDVGDVHALSTRIVSVLGDRNKRESLGAAGRAKANDSFRTDAVAARVRAIDDEVVSRGVR